MPTAWATNRVGVSNVPISHPSFDKAKLLIISVVGRNVIFSGESIYIMNTILDPDALVEVHASDGTLVYSQRVGANSTFSFQPPSIYGLFTVDCSTSYNTGETWFWLQDISNLVPLLVLPYSWSWQSIDYTLDANYVLTARLSGKQISVNWLQSLIALNPTITVSGNSAGTIQVHLVKGKSTLGYWMLNTYFGLTFRLQGSLQNPTTIDIPISVLGSATWGLNEIRVKDVSSNLVYSWDDILTRSTGVTFKLADEYTGKLSVTLQKTFDMEDAIFTDGFESGNFNAWSWSQGTVSVVSSPTHTGSYAGKAVWSTGTSAIWYKTTASSYADAYWRSYVQVTALPGSDKALEVANIFNAAWSEEVDALIYNSTLGFYYWAVATPAGWESDWVPKTINVNTWYCVELRRLVGDATHGHVELWVNGILIVDSTQAITGNSQQFMGGINFAGDSSGTMYGDDYVMDTSYIGTNPLSVLSTVSDIFVVNHDNFVNATVADINGRADVKNVTIQGSTNGAAQTFTLMWNQVTNAWSEVSDPNNIITINAAGSLNSTTDANTWVVDFKFKFTTGFTSGPVSITTKVMDSINSMSSTSTNLFNVGNINRVFVTFDDGFISQYTNATSVMTSNSITGTFYIIYDYVGTAGYVSWVQVAQLVSDGHEIGSHTRTHPHMNSISSTQLADETATVKSDFLTAHGITTLTLAYPFGEGWDNATVTSAVTSAGYLYARNIVESSWSRSAGTKTAVNSYLVDSTNHPTLNLALFETWVNQAYDNTEVILTYHYIGQGSDTNVDLTLFQQMMAYLHNKGFTTLPMSQVGGTLTATLSSSGSGSESILRTIVGTRSGSSSGSGSESATVQKVLARAFSDSGSGLDTLTRLFAPSRSSTDSGSGTESTSVLKMLQRTFSDVASGIEALAKLLVEYRTNADSGSGQESLARLLASSQSPSSSGSGSESVSAQQVLQRLTSETGTGLESLARLFASGRNPSDTGTGTEVISIQQILNRAVTDLGSGLESLSQLLSHGISLTDQGTGIETLTRIFTGNRSTTDTGSGSESPSVLNTLQRAFVDVGSGLEAVTRLFASSRTSTESGTGLESLTAGSILQRIVSDTGSGLESLIRQIVFGRTATDTGSGLDFLTAILTTTGTYIANISDQGTGTITLSRLFVASRGIFDLGSALETLTHLLTPYVPPSTGTGGGGVIVIMPRPTTVMVGALFPTSVYFLLPAAKISQDITVNNPTDTARVVTVHYTVTNIATGQIAYQDTLKTAVSPGSSTWTLVATITETGHYRIDITAVDGGTATAMQEFNVGLWQIWQGPVLLWSIIAFAAAALILFYRRIEEEW